VGRTQFLGSHKGDSYLLKHGHYEKGSDGMTVTSMPGDREGMIAETLDPNEEREK
jgi:hypothetical protein